MSELAAVLLPFEDSPFEDQVVVLCHCVMQAISIEEAELNGAIRRAQLLLATGGDPRRPLELDGRAVTALADDLDAPGDAALFEPGLVGLAPDLEELPALAAVLERLRGDSDLAWRGLCAALLADDLA